MEIIKLKTLSNCRDLGGTLTADGRKIKRHRLIRSENLNGTGDADRRLLLNEYSLKKIVDFRTDIECDQKPDPSLPGVEYIFNPILEASTMGITREKVSLREMPQIFENIEDEPIEYMKKLYSHLVLDGVAIEHYRRFMDILLNNTEGSVLWHCSAGKDRAGMGSALIMYALGVPEKTIIEDYMLTAYCYRFENIKLKLLASLFIRNKRSKAHIKELINVREVFITSAFDCIKEKYGSVENYLREAMVLTPEKLSLLKENYLE